ncbi:efflux RND transporter periplasmic adaptor subunit [Rhizobium sp. SL86]|uniref:efflux RND transporter periplasmic adaptor subunit n=1 Tax=Rhizobium sp. SL86 TaxID=2995148 RepID=UPI002274C57E|nr:efflux RND transporter periplasmic adaptor subunit [Rhizobium sp. SL86]MCY1668802.1 efflux RND transporter periplasmic adaptor subunit [Rhizobium sp. SL86]
MNQQTGEPGQHKPQTAPDLAAILASSRGKRRRSRWFVWPLTLAILAGGGAGAYFYLNQDGPAFTYTTQPVKRGDLSVIVTATGSLEPTDQVDISSELSGTVRKVNVTYNSPVKAGEVLAELDTNKLQADVQSARAKLASAKANVVKADAELNSARIKLERLRSLVDKSISSQQDLDTAQYAYDSAVATKEMNESSVLSSEADLRLAEVNLAKAKIVSPIDGVVLTRDVDPGQTVASSLSAPVLFTIAGDLKRMELQVSVDEADVGQVRENQPATFTVDAYSERTFPARIKTVRFASETVSNVVTYKAILSVDNEDLLLRPGMTATADITVQAVKDTLLVPNGALRYSPPATTQRSSGSMLSRLFSPPRPPGGSRNRQQDQDQSSQTRRPVFVLTDGQPRRVMVETGATDGQFTIVKSGDIQEGDALITSASTRSN